MGLSLSVIPAALASALLLLLPGVEAKSLWSVTPASGGRLLKEAFPLGNGRLGALPFGQPGQEKLNLNIDSLWSGGPFESATYSGGNPTTEKSGVLAGIRQNIFQTGSGNLTAFLGSNKDYGSYRVLANLTVTINGITQYAQYNRSLDLNTGVHSTTFLGNDNNIYTTATYCSHPAQACIYRVSSTGKLPNVAISVENRLIGSNLYNATCGPSQIRLNGVTQKGPPRGMEYDLLVRLSTGPLGMPMASCSKDQHGTLVVTGSAYGEDLVLKSFSVIIGAGTDYDQTKGNAANKFSFRGVKPGPLVDRVTAQSSIKLEPKVLLSHVQDYQGLMNVFGLELYDPWKASQYPSESLEFFQLLDRYKYSSGVTGNNKKRDTDVSKVEKRDSRYCIGKRCKRRPQYNGPPTSTTPAWQSIPTPTAFPEFNFPSTLHAGFNPSKPVPWSTDGFATVSIEGLGTRTITLTRSQTPLPTALPPIPSPTGPPVVRVNFAEENLADGPNAGQGDPYVESLLFDYARHLFISSSREESLPPNLQGIWTDQIESAWSGDFHANINFQMNHWFADQTGLGHLQTALWNYMQDTWVPRGAETAKLMYNAPGWVVHNEMNIFGHSGMKNEAKWADYPAAAAWMMQHVYDHWDYSRDLNWLRNSGYNLIREVTQFWLSQLQPDRYNQDETLVVNPCNSPERGPTTFACSHYQQLIHQLFTFTLAAADAVNDQDLAFTTALDAYLILLDKGIHISSWGGIMEFKLPESMGFDLKGEKHRHISHLVGWYPGYSIAAYSDGYRNVTIQKAVANALRSRGTGNSPDGNTGWGKVWRAAAWARLNNTEQADYHLRYAIYHNIGTNGLSIYDGRNGPFQIDANFGIAGAILSMLVVDMPPSHNQRGKRIVVLGPAIPPRWGPGKLRGLRVRGGTVLDMTWNNRGIVDKVSIIKKGEGCRFHSKEGKLIGEI